MISSERKVPIERSLTYRPKNYLRMKIKLFVRNRLDRMPVMAPLIKRAWVQVSFCWIQVRFWRAFFWNFITGKFSKSIHPGKTYWISPEAIIYTALTEFNFNDFKGRIIDGNWDKLEIKFSDLDVYTAFEQVCYEGKNWNETLFCQRIIKKIANGHVYWNCADEQSFKERCKNNEALFNTIRDYGYKTQKELLQGVSIDPRKIDDEITVSIGRYGDLLFSNSAHRLAIAKLLHLEKIPVKVAVRHSEWLLFLKKLDAHLHTFKTPPSHAFTHPDMIGLPSSNDDEERYKLIKENMVAKGGKLLDVGAKFGYLCQRFQLNGFSCYAGEATELQLELLNGIKLSEKFKFEVIDELFRRSEQIRNNRFDVTLALNSIHEVLKTRESFNYFIRFLGDLETNELYFQAQFNLERHRNSYYKFDSPVQLVEVILDNSSLSKSEIVGLTNGGVPLFRLYS